MAEIPKDKPLVSHLARKTHGGSAQDHQHDHGAIEVFEPQRTR